MPNPGDPIWATVRGNSATSAPKGVSFLSPNQIIVAGDFNFFQSAFVSLAAFSKYNVTSPPTDALDYTNTYGQPTCSYSFFGLAIDSSGNLLLTGTFCNVANFSNSYDTTYDMLSPGADGIFVVKLDSSGNLIWQTSFGGPSGTTTIQFGYDIDVDSDDNVLVTGTYNQAFSINTTLNGNTTLASSGGSSNDIFIMKFARDAAVGPGKHGQCIWAKGFTSTPANAGYIQGGHGVCVDSSKNVYCTGSFAGTINFGGSNLVCFGSGTSDPFIVKLDTNGNHVWSTSFPNSGYLCTASPTLGADNMARGARIKWTSPGILYVGGGFNGSCRFGTLPLSSQSCVDAFILKMDANNPSSISWISTIGGLYPSGATGIDTNRVMGLAVAPNGDLVVTGYFIGTGNIGFNGTTIGSIGPALGVWDTYVFRYSPDGTIVWKTTIGSSSSPVTLPARVAFDQNANIWFAVRFTGTLALGGTAGSISSVSPTLANWGVIQLYGGGGILPPNPADFTAIVYPSSGTIYTAGVTVSNGSGHVQFNDADSLNSKSLTTGTAVTFYGSPDNTVIPSNINPTTTYYVYRITGDDHNFWVTTINPDPSGTTLVNYVDSGTGSTFVRHDQHDWLNPAVSPLQKVGFSFRGAYPSGNTAIYFQFQWLASSTTSALAWPIPPTGTSLFKRTSTDVVYSGGWNWRAAFVPDFTSPAPADSSFCAWQNAKISAMVFNGGTIVNSSAVLFIPHVTTTDYSIGPMQTVAF